jgi:hypothetical protein
MMMTIIRVEDIHPVPVPTPTPRTSIIIIIIIIIIISSSIEKRGVFSRDEVVVQRPALLLPLVRRRVRMRRGPANVTITNTIAITIAIAGVREAGRTTVEGFQRAVERDI